MKKSMRMSLAIAAIVLAFVLPNLFAAQVVPPGDDFMIPKPEGIEIKKFTIPFPHSVHGAYGCATCHKVAVNKSCTTAGCHDLLVPATVEERRDIRFWEKAYHDRCIDCHRDLRRAEKPAGPVACFDCHRKPEAP